MHRQFAIAIPDDAWEANEGFDEPTDRLIATLTVNATFTWRHGKSSSGTDGRPMTPAPTTTTTSTPGQRRRALPDHRRQRRPLDRPGQPPLLSGPAAHRRWPCGSFGKSEPIGHHHPSQDKETNRCP